MAYAAPMRIVVVGAGHVGRALIGALHAITTSSSSTPTTNACGLRERYDVRTVPGDGTTRGVLRRPAWSRPIC